MTDQFWLQRYQKKFFRWDYETLKNILLEIIALYWAAGRKKLHFGFIDDINEGIMFNRAIFGVFANSLQ